MPKEVHPDEYGDIMVEAMRMVVSGPDEVIIPFQIWDMDDFDNELSIVFRAKGFEKVERLFALQDLIRDAWYGDGELIVLTDKEVYRASGSFKKPTPTKLPIKAARAIDGTPNSLLVVGEGIARFDGKKWSRVATPEKVELTCLSVHGDVTYAGGKDGILLEISGDNVKQLNKKPGKDVTAIFIDSKGILSVATRDGALQGPPNKLAVLELPKDVDHASGVCEFKGKIHWGCVGDGDGMGLFVQNGRELEPLFGEMAVGMTATDRFLFLPGEGGVVRYDGETVAALGLDFDDDKEQWKLEVAEIEEGDDEDAEDE